MKERTNDRDGRSKRGRKEREKRRKTKDKKKNIGSMALNLNQCSHQSHT